ncbi:hypothetical protein TSUD_49870 [Trifolium subterraneum]|uniref:Protein kinase domain-containing protein n=1 Tax=Trifolium subterraneum TaxID=3900 RepID=A0A2Z6MPX7_TRISU|nr:hypothetical protein TSUD_49870 [Trifolium subterraneum]
MNNWNSSDQNPCSWNGITCKDQTVVSISIPKRKLYGSLPSSLGSLSQLRHVNFRNNELFGALPQELFQAQGLQSLVLYGNSFSGSVPNEIQNLSGLIPASLGNLPEKVYIDLTYNNLKGPIPQNGALMNRGPTAFIGNPGLCGPPLKNPCGSDVPATSSPSSNPNLPDNSPPNGAGSVIGGSDKNKGLSKGAVVGIVDQEENDLNKGRKGRKECFCFRKDDSEALSDNVEQYDLVPLDSQVAFDLDELLKASAFVLGKSGIGIMYKVVLEEGIALAVRRLGEGEKLQEKQKSLSHEVAANILGNGYQAPEALKVVKPSQKWDVYSYGVILLELITGRLPIVQVGNSEMDLVQWIQFCIEEKKPLSDVLDPYLAEDADKEEEIIGVLKIAMACVNSSTEKRPTMRHVLDALDRLSVSSD